MKVLSWILKPSFSFLDVLIAILAVACCCVYFSRPPLDLFHQHSTDDPKAREYMAKAYADLVANRDVKMPPDEQAKIARLFHELDIWPNMWWMGIRTQKNPCDLWMMQQVLFEVQPDFIIEAGTFRGGSALFFAQILDGIGLKDSKVITLDIFDQCREAAEHPLWKSHVEFLLGSSTDPKIVEQVKERVAGKKVLVVLDSVHTREHVLNELNAYAPLVSAGSYVVVEDTSLDLHLTLDSNGPTAAVKEFLQTDAGREFRQDFSREALVLTFNPGGWLKRIDPHEVAPRKSP